MRRRLVAVSFAVTAMVALAFLVPLAGLVRELSRSRALTAAERDAQLVAQLVTLADPPGGLPAALGAIGIVDTFNGREISLVLSDGSVTGSPIPESEDLMAAFAGAAGEVGVDGGAAVYAPVVTGDGTLVVRVFVPSSELDRNVARSWMILGALGLVLIGIGVVAADRLGRSLVRPVEELGQAAQRLGRGDLGARVKPSGPDELVEVGTRFNELAGRVADLLQEERETAADLSHRLRTPLTALKLDIEGMCAGDDRDRLIEDLDVLERTIDHVIGEARRVGRQGRAGTTDLRAAVATRASFWKALADEQGRKTTFDDRVSGDASARIAGADLNAAVDALIGNVFAHTPEPTGYTIILETRGNSAFITVSDEGQGLPTNVTLGRGVSTAGSTGLGLDIARRTAEAAGGRLVPGGTRLGGTQMVLEFPLDGPSRSRNQRN